MNETDQMSKPVFPHVRIVVALGGPDGNAFAVMGRVTAAMRDAKIDQSAPLRATRTIC